jgi:hypothetical protein
MEWTRSPPNFARSFKFESSPPQLATVSNVERDKAATWIGMRLRERDPQL